jgi:hypothetical protein
MHRKEPLATTASNTPKKAVLLKDTAGKGNVFTAGSGKRWEEYTNTQSVENNAVLPSERLAGIRRCCPANAAYFERAAAFSGVSSIFHRSGGCTPLMFERKGKRRLRSCIFLLFAGFSLPLQTVWVVVDM